MLNEWQKNFKKYIPKQIPGYDFVSRVPIYIPIKTINISVWERQIQRLSFIQECILFSISINSKSIDELADEFGVPESVMIQIISDLDTEQLAGVSAGMLVLTDKGKNALQEQKRTKIVQNKIGGLHVNQITGEITDAPLVGTFNEPPFGQTYLNERFSVVIEFLRRNFETVATIYNESITDNYSFQKNIDSAKLYRILDILHSELSYIKEYCLVYINQDDKTLSFQFQSGIQAYSEALSEQLKQNEKGAWNLLKQPPRQSFEQTVNVLPVKLIETTTSKVNSEKRAELAETEYYNARPLLDGEINDILQHISDFRAEKVYMEAPYLNEFINNDVLSAIFSSHTKELIVRYSGNDRNADKIINNMKSIPKKQKRFRLDTKSIYNCSYVKIYIGDKCAIVGSYKKFDTIYHMPIYRLNANITYDKKVIDGYWSELLNS